jgi:RNA-directed DNA polymerase
MQAPTNKDSLVKYHQRVFIRLPWHKKLRFKKAHAELKQALQGKISKSCTHTKGHGGIKLAVARAHKAANSYSFCARFDVKSYYESMHRPTLLKLVQDSGTSPQLLAAVKDYLNQGPAKKSETGLICGGSLSPLLAALYLRPLDTALDRLASNKKISYCRYMDDFVIFANSRWYFKKAVRKVQQVLKKLKLALHPKKRFIGRVKKGFSFLGYFIRPNRRLRPSATSLERLKVRSHRLYEQKACKSRLWDYITRWTRWLWGALGGLVSTKGGIKRYYYHILGQLRQERDQTLIPSTVLHS